MMYQLIPILSTPLNTGVYRNMIIIKWKERNYPTITLLIWRVKLITNNLPKERFLILKCWFLDCLPCIKEIPALNELKQRYKNRNDILFVSICWDQKKDVEEFLKKTTFNYAVVPNQYKFLTERLQLNAYPTHFVINKQGLITKKLNDYTGITYALKKSL